MASVPGDWLLIFWSWAGANIPVPPFGTLELDPNAGFILAGAAKVPITGVDPIAEASFSVTQDTSFLGLKVHAQALDWPTSTNRPRLTNSIVTTITR